MSKNRLEELKESSKSALCHIELVELARVQTPSQAWKLARTAKWPKRQAEACRSLATLRRDHGNEVFTDFIATMERVRAGNPVTEQVQDNRRKTVNSNIEKNLNRVTDPIAKLRLALKHDLKPQVTEIINDLVKNNHAFFWTDFRGNEVLFDTLQEVERPGGLIPLNDSDVVEKVIQHQTRVGLVFKNEESKSQVILDLLGMQNYCGMSDEDLRTIVRSVLSKHIEKPAAEHGWRFLNPTTTAVRSFLPVEEDFTKQVEIWLLQCHFRGGRLFELRKTALPIPIQDNPEDDRRELDPIVDRFLELGWTEEQVREEFLGFIRDHLSNCRPQFMLAAAGAKCFNREHAERDELLQGEYRSNLWNEMVRSDGDFQIEMFYKFAWLGFRDMDRREENRKFYQDKLVELLSSGYLAKTFQILLLIGHKFNLYYAEMERGRFEESKKYMLQIIPLAFRNAYASGRFGTAAAFVQQFGKQACYNEAVLGEEAKQFVEPDLQQSEEKYAEVEKKWNAGEPDEYFESGEGKEWQDSLSAIEEKRKAKLEELKSEANDQIDNVTQLALDLNQPIRFQGVFAYYAPPEWPKH